MISQSGNVAVNALGSRRGIRYHTVLSTGNQTVLDASHWLRAVCDRDGVRSVAMFLEEDGDGERLANALADCAERGVRVAVLKVGRSEAGARAASAHTGAVAGDQRVFRALIEEAGGAWAHDPHELLELARALAEPRARPRGDGGLAILTCSGGDSSIAADEAARIGAELPELAPGTRERLAELLPSAATVGNPLDYTAMIWGDTDLLRRIAVTVGADQAVDQLLFLYDHPQGLAPEAAASWAAVRAGIVAGAEEAAAATLVASTLPDLIDDEATHELADRGVPVIAGLRTALACAQAVRLPQPDPERLRQIASAAAPATPPSGPSGGPAATSPAPSDPGRGPTANGWVDEAEAKEMLRAARVEVPEGQVVASEDECVDATRELGGHVALKLCRPGLLHKAEAGALALDLRSEHEVREAYRRLASTPAADGARVLVEAMAPPGVELLVAARADAVVPSLVVGMGGVLAEALDDVAIVPLPADERQVEVAIRSLRGAVSLGGGPGREAADVASAARLGAAIGELLPASGLDLLELNPVVVHREGCVALDARGRAPRRLGPRGGCTVHQPCHGQERFAARRPGGANFGCL